MHTPTPYEVVKIDHSVYIQTVKGEHCVCDLEGNLVDTPDKHARIEATAEFIVRACNSHDALLEACEYIAKSAMPDMNGKVLISTEAFQAINAAIAKAKKGE